MIRGFGEAHLSIGMCMGVWVLGGSGGDEGELGGGGVWEGVRKERPSLYTTYRLL